MHLCILLVIALFLCALKLRYFVKQKLYNVILTGLLGLSQNLELEFLKVSQKGMFLKLFLQKPSLNLKKNLSFILFSISIMVFIYKQAKLDFLV